MTQGLMWRATNPDGSLMYPDFVETVRAIRPLYMVRMLGGLMYLSSFIIMGWNLIKTARAGHAVDGQVDVVIADEPEPQVSWVTLVTGRPMVFIGVGLVCTMALGITGVVTSLLALAGLLVLGCAAYVLHGPADPNAPKWHALLEGRPLLFTVLTLIAILVGGVAELLPTIAVSKAVPSTGAPQQPYSALELEGRDLYVREGCYNCHSQNIRSFYWETQRYGAVSRAEEFIYDHPFQWGSKRTGPDLSRVGGKYPHLWHYSHLVDPRAVSAGSNMPSFKWLTTGTIDTRATGKKLALMQKLGVPYSNAEVDRAEASLRAQGEGIVQELATQGIQTRWNSEMVAMIAYLQRLGRGPQMPKEGPNVPVALLR